MYILLDTVCITTVDSGACLINHIKKPRSYEYLEKLKVKFAPPPPKTPRRSNIHHKFQHTIAVVVNAKDFKNKTAF